MEKINLFPLFHFHLVIIRIKTFNMKMMIVDWTIHIKMNFKKMTMKEYLKCLKKYLK